MFWPELSCCLKELKPSSLCVERIGTPFPFSSLSASYTIRAYTYNPEEAKSQGEALEKLEDERSKRWVESPIRRRCNFV
jgi:hypothetical protein